MRGRSSQRRCRDEEYHKRRGNATNIAPEARSTIGTNHVRHHSVITGAAKAKASASA